ncbi:hypothetical protein C8Q80DRAFT_272210 [Daedaleopsis nitida]|nr:hypothetical protein C8Q80DRAFT_272210 [Daedaleopsis nitida]
MRLPREIVSVVLAAAAGADPEGLAGPAAALPQLPALDNTYGALFLGMAFGLMLYGLTCHQTYRYFRLYPRDVRLIKSLVTTIWTLETFHTILVIVACYYRLVSNYFHPETLAIGHWSTRLLTPVTGITVLVCQSFYARRVWMVGPGYRYLVWIAAVFMFTALAFTISATVEGFIRSLADFKHVSWMVSVIFGSAVIVDILLTTALIVVLVRSRTGFQRTDSTIEVLVLYTVNTGLLTSFFGLLVFIFAVILPGNFIYIGISIVGTKLYANSVLAVLNSRRALSNKMLQGFELSSIEATNGRPHTAIETWDVPGFPVDTNISFATPTNVTSLESSTAMGSGGDDDKYDDRKTTLSPSLKGRGRVTI